MRIGIVTINDLTNYGNRLQNYAMYYILKKKYCCEVISLTATKEKPYCNGSYMTWIKEKVAGLSCIFPTWAERRFGPNITRWENFRKWNKLIPSKVYYGCDSIPEEKDIDFFVAGSDQIWNYHFSAEHFEDYFLHFAKKSQRIAVSASFGVDSIPDEWKSMYQVALQDFSKISVREEAGQIIIKDLLGIDVPVLIDPTMMLTKNEWLHVAKKPRVDCSKPYVLKYYLGNEIESEKIDIWAKEKGYEVYELLNKDIPELYSAGPGEFISLIGNADLVCSDSYHCIVFSIIFSKPFLVYARQGSEDYMTSRLDTLLRKFGFENRWKSLVAEEEYLNCDYSMISGYLENERRQFTEFIENIIEK